MTKSFKEVCEASLDEISLKSLTKAISGEKSANKLSKALGKDKLKKDLADLKGRLSKYPDSGANRTLTRTPKTPQRMPNSPASQMYTRKASYGEGVAEGNEITKVEKERPMKAFNDIRGGVEEVKLDEGLSPAQIAKMKKQYSTTGERISTDAAMKMSAMVKKFGDEELVQLAKADIKWISTSAITTLIIKGKGSLLKESVELNELTAAEKKLVAKMYDKKGNLTPLGKKVMDHGKKNEELDEVSGAAAVKLGSGNAILRDPKTGKLNPKGKMGGVKQRPALKGRGATVEEVELDENKSLIKDYEKYMSQGNKKDHNAIDYLMSMSKYKRMSKDQMAKMIGDHKRKGIFKEEVEQLDAAMLSEISKSKEGTIRIVDLSSVHPDNRMGAKEKSGFQVQRMTKGKFVNQGKPYKSAKEAEKMRKGGQHSMQFEQLGENLKLINRIKNSGVVKTGSMAKDAPVKKEETLDEKGPKIRPDFLAVQRAKDKAQADSKGVHVATGRKKRTTPMTSTQKSLASIRREHAEIAEAKKGAYEIYHKDFSGAMQHAYDAAKKNYGITVKSSEIDDKVASGPRKPSNGKTNTYRLKGDKGAIQVQVYNTGNKYELNMYKE